VDNPNNLRQKAGQGTVPRDHWDRLSDRMISDRSPGLSILVIRGPPPDRAGRLSISAIHRRTFISAACEPKLRFKLP